MKLISWNVNGIRAVLRKGCMSFFESCDADVICIQETKAQPEQVDLDLPGYQAFWNSAERKGYSGTLMLTRRKPMQIFPDMGIAEHDREGRVLTAEFESFYLTTVYTPNSQRGLTRLDYRMQWDRDFLAFVKNLEKSKPVIFCGDLNVAHKEIDLANPKSNVNNHGFTPQERQGFDNIVQAGFVDTFREFTQGPGHYTWWSPMFHARTRNVGWRIDYFFVSASLKDRIKEATIYDQVTGSDHCPVGIELTR